MAIQDMTGQKFGKLTVLSLDRPRSGKSHWLCLCECGETRSCIGAVLRQGRVKACRSCSLEGMRARLSRKPVAQRPRLYGPKALIAALDDEGRRLYERWQVSCAKLSIQIMPQERMDVLRELVDRRKAA